MSTLIPREVIFGNPEKTSPEISPDGKRIAYIAPHEGVLNVWLRTVGQTDDRVVTQDQDRGIRMYFWAKDNRHILYLQDRGGNENWRLYGVDVETGENKDYTPFDEVQAQVLHLDKHFPDTLLIAMNKENPQVHDVYTLSLASGELKRVAENSGNIVGWVTDTHMQVRGAVAAQPDGSMDLLVRPSVDADWQVRRHWDMEDTLTSSPVGFSRDGEWLYLIDSHHTNAGRLLKIHQTRAEEQILAEDPRYDVSSAVLHPDTYEVQAVAFNRARHEWQVLDPAIAEDFAYLKQLNPGDFSLDSRDDADQTWLVHYVVDNGPVAFYAYDRQNRQATFLFFHKALLRDYTLANMEPISFQSRDGLTIEGYISFPPGQSRSQPQPMVLNVHGGPWWRDNWGYHAEAQWLTNRGYVCLQVNYRGSTGYGKQFLNAGDKEWGGKMHLDLLDAVNWAVAKGYADPKRVAIYGGSYGGYAALVGATFTPDVFCCAIDMVGPSSLLTLIASFPAYWSTMLENFKKRVGDPDTEEEFLKSRSPLFKVDQIKIPLLIAQGANDPRVTEVEAQQIVAALESKGLPHEYLLFADEGHGLAKPQNRLKFYAAVEAFLARHLGGQFES